MTTQFREIAHGMVPLFASAGFVVSDELIDPLSDNGLIEMSAENMFLRLVRDRTQWFIEVRASTVEEWFDSRFVLAVIGDTQTWIPPAEERTLQTFVQHFVSMAPRWKLLFHPGVYEQSKRQINELELISARERFNYVPER